MRVKLGGKVTVSSKAQGPIKLILKCKFLNQWVFKEILTIFPHLYVSKWGAEYQKWYVFSNAFLFPFAHSFWLLQEQSWTLQKSISVSGVWVLSKRLNHFRVSTKEKIPEKSDCPHIKQDLSFKSFITANVIKSSYCIEEEQKKSMENYLTEAEGSAWEVGDDKPCRQCVFARLSVSFIVMQPQTWRQMLYDYSLTVNCEGILSIFFLIYSDFVKPCSSKLCSLFQHAKDSRLYNVNTFWKPQAVFFLLYNLF